MLNWLKRQIAGKELAELDRYRLASAEAFRWNVGHVPAAAETADWIIRVAEGVTPLSPEKLRDRLMRPNSAVTDASGEATLSLWPNTRGQRGDVIFSPLEREHCWLAYQSEVVGAQQAEEYR